MSSSLTLSTGDKLPSVGLGLWKVDPSEAPSLIQSAVDAGYRHFDCACDYGNEDAVGEGLQAIFDSGAVSRSDVWLTSKLWNTYHAAEHVRPALERTLRDLRVDALDLYLIHFPIAQQFVPFETRYPPGWFTDPDAAEPKIEPAKVPIQETWRAMESLVREGLVRNIGFSNFNCSLIRDVLSYAEIRPSVLQIESHPYLTQEKLVRYCQQEDIAVTAFSPLGAPSYVGIGMAEKEESVMNLPEIKAIAESHGRSPAQVVLRWGVQRGTAIVPKTSKPERLKENISLFDFELTNQEMQTIASLNRNRRFNDPGVFCEEAFNTFFPIYE
ncbi:aldo/keto reductase [Thalassoroseus pseudoceratinae]|uniref:aldo/keto reductase n=1 Tax=Thalassoroseus pseudoceratinae TaxID=2713176 RepID=UPI00142149E5|nr:aldo/keto reductase [Thalassoroseus pseudoceratinae]